MWDDARRDPKRRLTIDQAADRLGITVDAVRGRVKRDTIAHEREGGRVYVLLDADQSRPGRDQDDDQAQSESSALTSELRDRLRYVEGQLEAERQAHAEARRIIAGLVERIPAIEAPQEPTGASETGAEEPGRAGGSPDRAETQEGAQRPWWRFWR